MTSEQPYGDKPRAVKAARKAGLQTQAKNALQKGSRRPACVSVPCPAMTPAGHDQLYADEPMRAEPAWINVVLLISSSKPSSPQLTQASSIAQLSAVAQCLDIFVAAKCSHHTSKHICSECLEIHFGMCGDVVQDQNLSWSSNMQVAQPCESAGVLLSSLGHTFLPKACVLIMEIAELLSAYEQTKAGGHKPDIFNRTKHVTERCPTRIEKRKCASNS